MVEEFEFHAGMYRPIRETLLVGLRSRSRECGYVVDAAWGRRAARSRLKAGDVAIWVGVLWQDFAADCVAADHACLMYVTEPRGRDAPRTPPDGIRELWTYTRAHGEGLRYVPPGYVKVDDGADARVRDCEALRVDRFTWLGSPWGAQRKKCLHALTKVNPKTRGRTDVKRDVWTPSDWKQLAKTVDSAVFLNMHKACGDPDSPLEAVRLASLLSVGAVVVTEPSFDADRAEFAGLVLTEKAFAGDEWTEETKDFLFDRDPADLANWRRNAYETFKVKFDPARILRNAGVWNS